MRVSYVDPPWGLRVTDVSVEELSVAWETFDLTPQQHQATIFPLNDSETAAPTQVLYSALT